MARVSAVMSYATGADLDTMLVLVTDSLTTPTAGSSSPHPAEVITRMRERLETAQIDIAAGRKPSYRLVVASVDGIAVGFASLSVLEEGLLAPARAVLVDVVHVDSDHRKMGIGKSLIRGGIMYAEEIGATDLTVNAPVTSREANRFFARYGFAPLITRRSASVSSLRRRIGVEPVLGEAVSRTPEERSKRRLAVLSPRLPGRRLPRSSV